MSQKTWYDSTGNEVYYDSTAKKILTKGANCPYCDPSPWAFKAVPSGILCCLGVGNCCGGGSMYKILDQGIGWNVEALLQWGKWSHLTGKWVQSFPTNPCFWSELLHDDFGSFEKYNLANCQGGVEYTGHFITRYTFFQNMGALGWAFGIELWADEFIPSVISHIYGHTENDEVCVPYDVEYSNSLLCSGGKCIGDGTVELIAV